MKKMIEKLLTRVVACTEQKWYLPLIATLAAIDAFFCLMPLIAFMAPIVAASRKRWFTVSLGVATGLGVGSIALSEVVRLRGLSFVDQLFPSLSSSSAWQNTFDFVNKYGVFGVFSVAVSPLPYQPAAILAALGKISTTQIAFAVWTASIIKLSIINGCVAGGSRIMARSPTIP